MQPRTFRRLRGVSVAGILVLAIGVGCFAMLRIDPWADRGGGLPSSFDLDLTRYVAIDPALLRYAQVAHIDVGMSELHAVAVGREDRVYVAGDREIRVFQPDGTHEATIPLAATPTCLAVGASDHLDPGRVYVGVQGHVELFEPDGSPAGAWQDFGESAVLTSIAVAARDVFVADAENRIVIRFDHDGRPMGRIGEHDAHRQMPGFIVPSPYFDVAVGDDQSLFIVNPGARRIEVYAFDGALQTFWGEASPEIAGFFGCCNPAHMALLPDGRFVTSEKGIPRVKIYTRDGDLDCVVAGPSQLAVRESMLGDPRSTPAQSVYDVATDSQGRVLVLDPMARTVRIFTPTHGPSETDR